MKQNLGYIAIIITFFGSEIVLDYWLGVQSLQTKILFLIVIVLIYSVAIKQVTEKTKTLKK